MAKFCQICAKGGMIVQQRSHSNIATRHKQQVNLQSKRLGGMKIRMCTTCMKTLKRENVLA